MTLTVGSLFSGIGGLDLGLERAGMKVIWQSEIDPYANRVLQKHWPEVPNLGNIKDIDWRRVERPAVICGGYPCQPFSQAGRRKGEEDSRHLWPWVRQAIGELQPDYAILENVRGHLSLGGTTVIADLAAIGYDAEWRIVSAASVGANHRRDRIIIVAYPNDTGNGTPRRRTDRNRSPQIEIEQHEPFAGVGRCGEAVADPDSIGLQGTRSEQQTTGPCRSSEKMANSDIVRYMDGRITVYPTDGRFPTLAEPAERGWWKTEPDVGRVADGVPARVDRLRGLGNAVVPQVAEVIGRLVIEHASQN